MSSSFHKSFASLGYLHNESVNIYSHLIGAGLFTGAGALMYTLVKHRYEKASASDIAAFGCFFAGAFLCLGMSGTYHTISNHSPMVARFGNKLDYVGIVFLITGSFIPSIFYGFYCHPHLQEFYWTMVRTFDFQGDCAHQLCRFAQSDLDVLQSQFSIVSELLLGGHIEPACLSSWDSRLFSQSSTG